MPSSPEWARTPVASSTDLPLLQPLPDEECEVVSVVVAGKAEETGEAEEETDSEDEAELGEEVDMVCCIGRWLLYSLAGCGVVVIALILYWSAQEGKFWQTLGGLLWLAFIAFVCPAGTYIPQ